MTRYRPSNLPLLGLCFAILSCAQVVAQTCGHAPGEPREYLGPPADVAWPYFVVEFGAKGQGALATYIVEGSEGRRIIRGYASTDGRRWQPQQALRQNRFAPPLNGQNPPIQSIAPWDDSFRIAYDQKSLRSTSDGGQHWRDVGEMEYLMAAAKLRGERAELESLGRKGQAPTVRSDTWRALIVSRIVYVPNRRGRIFLLTNKGLYRTDDYGEHWSLLPVGIDMIFEVQSLAIDPGDTDRLLVGTTRAVYFSSDGGCRFEKVLSPGPNLASSKQRKSDPTR